MTQSPYWLSYRNEREFNEAVREVLRDLTHLDIFAYHTRNSRGSIPGFPDWVILVGDRGWALELKVRGKLTRAQERWLAAFGRLPNWTALEVRPPAWPAIRDSIIDYATEVRKGTL